MANDREQELAFYAAQEAVEIARVSAARADETAATARRVEAEQRLAAIRLLMGKPALNPPPTSIPSSPSVQDQPVSVAAKTPQEAATWPDVVLGLLKGKAEGLTAQGIVEGLSGTFWADKYRRQPNSLYNTLNRLHRTDKIARIGKRYYDLLVAPMLHGDPAQSPPLEAPEEAALARMSDLIKGVLREANRPLKAAEVIVELRKIPGVSDRIGPLGNLAYTHMSKMFRGGDLNRVAEGYTLPGHAPRQPENVTLFPMARGQGGEPV